MMRFRFKKIFFKFACDIKYAKQNPSDIPLHGELIPSSLAIPRFYLKLHIGSLDVMTVR